MLGTSWAETEKICLKRVSSYESTFTNSKSFAEEVADALCTRAGTLGKSHPSVLVGRETRLIEALLDIANAVRTASSHMSDENRSEVHPDTDFENFLEDDFVNPAEMNHEKPIKDYNSNLQKNDFDTNSKFVTVENITTITEGESITMEGNAWAFFETEDDITFNGANTYMTFDSKLDDPNDNSEEFWTVPLERGDNFLTSQYTRQQSINRRTDDIYANVCSLSEKMSPKRRRRFFKRKPKRNTVFVEPVSDHETGSENRANWKETFRSFLNSNSLLREMRESFNCGFRDRKKATEAFFCRMRKVIGRWFSK